MGIRIESFADPCQFFLPNFIKKDGKTIDNQQ